MPQAIEKLSRHLLHVSSIYIDQAIEPSHSLLVNRPAKRGKGCANLRTGGEHLGPNDRCGFVRREVLFVVPQVDQLEGLDLPIGGVAGNDVHLAFGKRPIGQPQVHHGRLHREAEPIGVHQPTIPVFPLHELVAEAWPPVGGVRHGT